MKRYLLPLLLLFSLNSFSQDNEPENFWDNVRFGGGFGLGFGNNTTTVAISPTAIYDFNESYSLGAGIGYQYSKRGDSKANVFSASVLSLYNPIYEIQLSAEFEQLFVSQSFGNLNDNFSYPALYIGAAYRIGQNFTLGLRYDVLYNENESIYASAVSPIVRVFF